MAWRGETLMADGINWHGAGSCSYHSYSAKRAAKGKDIGKPGKNFSKIAAKAGKKYGSKEAGERVGGAILKK